MDRTYDENPVTRFITAARKLQKLCEWLEDCPSSDGQAYYETAHGELTELAEEAIEAAMASGNKEVEQAARELVEDGPPRCRQEAEIWELLADVMEGKTSFDK
jgi:hypothetical protein